MFSQREGCSDSAASDETISTYWSRYTFPPSWPCVPERQCSRACYHDDA